MDAMPLLRSCREALPEPDAARMRALKAPLERRMAPPRRSPRPARVRGAVLALAGGAVAATVVAGVVLAGPAPRASAEAARLLQGAATAAASTGEVRTVLTRERSLSMRQGADGAIDAAYIDRIVTVLRVPAGGGEWVRTRYSLAPTVFYGGAAGRELAAEERTDSATREHPVVERSADGDFTNGELGGGEVFGDDPAVLRDLPRDADALLAALRRADLGAAPQGGAVEHVLEAAAVVLRSGAADADLQASVFRALLQQPGLVVADDAAVLDGRSGTAIGAAAGVDRSESYQLVVDPATGAYLGDRTVALVAEGVVPAGAVLSETAVEQR